MYIHTYIQDAECRVNEGDFYIVVPIHRTTFTCCNFIFALRNIALGGYLDMCRDIEIIYRKRGNHCRAK